MDCNRFEQILDELVAQHSAGQLDERAREHATTCTRCQRLLSIASGQLDVLGSGAPALVQTILAHTTGSPCAQAEQLAADGADRLLTADESALLAAHAAHCAACAKLISILAEMAVELPQMARVEPDAAFVRDVMQTTWVADRPWHERARRWWERMVARPRFALEVGYSFALVLALLCGTPVSPLREAPGKVLATLQLHPQAAVQGVSSSVDAVGGVLEMAGTRAWDNTGGRVLGTTAELRSELGGRRRGITTGWWSLSGHVRDLTRGLLHGNLNTAALSLKAAGRDCGQIWNSFWKGPRPQPQPQPSANEADVNG